MHNHYILNGVVEFHPATSTLRRLDEQQNIVVLNSPAGRCLLQLIHNQGKVVTQKEFMEEVWLKSGIVVSANTYYQNISILRKGLKKIGFEEELVITISRIGLTLADNITIEKRETDKPFELDIMKDEESGNEEHKIERDAPSKKTCIKENASEKPKGRITAFIITLFSIVLLFAGTYYYTTGGDYYQDFIMFKTSDTCNIYHHPRMTDQNSLTTLLRYGELFTGECDTMPYIYVDNYPLLPRISVIRCPEPITHGDNCISELFTGTE